MGNVLSAKFGTGPCPAGSFTGWNKTVTPPAPPINKVCAFRNEGGDAGRTIHQCGQTNLLIAGGNGSMSNTPYYLPKAKVLDTNSDMVT